MSTNANINAFFPQINGDFSLVTWAHAVNSKEYLKQVLNDDNIMMIEADVVIGKLTNQNVDIPIMAHPPNKTSDLSLEEFLQQVHNFNEKASISKSQGKGIKLDFKQNDALISGIEIVKSINKKDYPLWLNADILDGHFETGPNKTIPVDAKTFFTAVKDISLVTLSLGWTTCGFNSSQGYKEEEIAEMIDVILSNNVSNTVTFAVRACLLANTNKDHLRKLLHSTRNNNSTFTIWSHYQDNVNIENLKNIVVEFGVQSMFFDVPQELIDKLELGRDNDSTYIPVAVLS